MGQRFEKSKKNVTENRSESDRINAESKTLREEYASLGLLESIERMLDDEAIEAIGGVKATGEIESQRLENETRANEAERKEIAVEIDREIAKLDDGLRKLRGADDIAFGARAIEQSQREYKKQIEQFKALMENLTEGQDSTISTAFSNEFSDASTFGGKFEVAESPFVNDVVVAPRADPLEPTRSTPRDLAETQYGFKNNGDGTRTYDSPEEMGAFLYSKQGSAHPDFKGTCGLCSCANILRLAGVNYGERDMIDFASNEPYHGIWPMRLCKVGSSYPEYNGGTIPEQRKEILEHFGINSSIHNVPKGDDGKASIEAINHLGQSVASGRGVIIDVDAGAFYDDPRYKDKGHAVTVTSVTYDANGDVCGFHILDSNFGTVYKSASEIQEAIRPFVGFNVTNQIIR